MADQGKQKRVPGSPTASKSTRKAKQKDLIIYFIGAKLKEVTCDESKFVWRASDERWGKWATTATSRGTKLVIETDETFQIVKDYNVVGCMFKRNLGLPDLQEAVVILLEEAVAGRQRMCICLSRVVYSQFACNAVLSWIHATDVEASLRTEGDGGPVVPAVDATGDKIVDHIIALLQWTKTPYVDSWALSRKGAIDYRNPPKKITIENLSSVHTPLLDEYKNVNIFGSEGMEIPLEKCILAPNEMKCRDFDEDCALDFKNSFWAYNAVSFEKKVVYLVPCLKTVDQLTGTERYEALSIAPRKEDLGNYSFWIIGGQHTIMAYKDIVSDESMDESFRDMLRVVTGVIFWAPPTLDNNLKLMALSKSLNNINDNRLGESQFLIIARQV